MAGNHGAEHVANERGRGFRNRRKHVERGRYGCRNLHFMQIGERLVHGRPVLLHHSLAALPVGLLDGLFDFGDGLIARQDPANSEEARLEDGIHARAHARLAGHAIGVNHKEAQLLVDDLFLHLSRQVRPHVRRAEGRVEQEHSAGGRAFEHVNAVQELELMAAHEAGALNQVSGADGIGPEAQVRHGDGAGFLRVVNEITLHVVRRVSPDDFHGVFRGAHGAIRTQAVEHSAHRAR